METSSNYPSITAIVIMAILFFSLFIGMWKVFEKAGQPGWSALIPFYGSIILLKVAQKPLWWFFLFIIPVINVAVAFVVINNIAKLFGKEMIFSLGLMFLPFIFYPVLGFSAAKYQFRDAKKEELLPTDFYTTKE